MKAKDTVMSLEQMTDKIWAMGCKADDEGVAVTQKLRFETIAEEQAEISFKAGYQEGQTDREMRLLTEEEIMQIRREMGGMYLREFELIQAGALAQDIKTHKATLKAVIKDLEMIMKEAPDLKSLEKMIADYITERRGEMPEAV